MERSEIIVEPGRTISRASNSEFESEIVVTMDGITGRVQCRSHPDFESADDLSSGVERTDNDDEEMVRAQKFAEAAAERMGYDAEFFRARADERRKCNEEFLETQIEEYRTAVRWMAIIILSQVFLNFWRVAFFWKLLVL